MDLTTLKTNLLQGRYTMLSDFLKDAHLIFENCRVYNGNSNNGLYSDLANETQDLFIK